jgi:hypothetical protein
LGEGAAMTYVVRYGLLWHYRIASGWFIHLRAVPITKALRCHEQGWME